jgi:hypothetical protein
VFEQLDLNLYNKNYCYTYHNNIIIIVILSPKPTLAIISIFIAINSHFQIIAMICIYRDNFPILMTSTVDDPEEFSQISLFIAS